MKNGSAPIPLICFPTFSPDPKACFDIAQGQNVLRDEVFPIEEQSVLRTLSRASG